jgi:uncharacterized membrane protein YraQ (UPF0718 family)
MVFLISSPLMSPSAFFVTLGGLGMGIALWKLFSAIVLGLAAGCVTDWLWERKYVGKSILRVKTEPQEQEKPISRSRPDSDVPITCEPVVTEKYGLSFLRLIGKYSIFIGKFIIIAVIAQALMVRYVPQDWVVAAVGTKHSYSVFISTVIGIPAYINSISAVPLLKGLMDLGMDKGAALAFIIAGPVMSVPSILAVMALFRRQALYIYVIVGFIGALAFGYTFRLF